MGILLKIASKPEEKPNAIKLTASNTTNFIAGGVVLLNKTTGSFNSAGIRANQTTANYVLMRVLSVNGNDVILDLNVPSSITLNIISSQSTIVVGNFAYIGANTVDGATQQVSTDPFTAEIISIDSTTTPRTATLSIAYTDNISIDNVGFGEKIFYDAPIDVGVETINGQRGNVFLDGNNLKYDSSTTLNEQIDKSLLKDGSVQLDSSFVPTNDFDISTKKYVDDLAAGGVDLSQYLKLGETYDSAEEITITDSISGNELILGAGGISSVAVQTDNLVGSNVSVSLVDRTITENIPSMLQDNTLITNKEMKDYVAVNGGGGSSGVGIGEIVGHITNKDNSTVISTGNMFYLTPGSTNNQFVSNFNGLQTLNIKNTSGALMGLVIREDGALYDKSKIFYEIVFEIYASLNVKGYMFLHHYIRNESDHSIVSYKRATTNDGTVSGMYRVSYFVDYNAANPANNENFDLDNTYIDVGANQLYLYDGTNPPNLPNAVPVDFRIIIKRYYKS